jgi:hypothetical protein
MFRTVRLSIIRSLFTVHSAFEQDQDGTAVPSWSCSKAVYKLLWHIPLLNVQWINSWWWTDELSETCRVSWQNKFVKLVHLVGFIIKKFVTIQHGHMLRCSTVTCYDTARSHVTVQHGHMLRYSTVTCYDTARSHERKIKSGFNVSQYDSDLRIAWSSLNVSAQYNYSQGILSILSYRRFMLLIIYIDEISSWWRQSKLDKLKLN